LSIRG